jgi:molybdopterin-guanine dinucleotide biosynthesis protein A
MRNLSAIILAGGKSSRMGRDKALISLQGIPLLQRICDLASSCTDIVYIVTPWPERYQHLSLPDCEFICETSILPLPYTHGPLVGFAQGLKQVKTDWVLLLACDLPKLRLDVFQDWGQKLPTVESGAIAYLVRHPQGWEPLCGFYRRRCLPELMDFIYSGGRSFQDWLKHHSVAAFPLSEPEILFNCNTPEDLRKLALD